ncbi:MAG: PilZ domain-containing protein [Treponema sp.]|jgi:hypothetical protein|nr:PilZ domain-containing protein [Treponema sp.]
MVFFRKVKPETTIKKEEENRKLPRYSSIASVRIDGFDGVALVKDMSDSGCCIESLAYLELDPGEIYHISIFPEITANIPCFKLDVKMVWSKSSETCFETGLELVESPTDKELQHYLDYLKWRTSTYVSK